MASKKATKMMPLLQKTEIHDKKKLGQGLFISCVSAAKPDLYCTLLRGDRILFMKGRKILLEPSLPTPYLGGGPCFPSFHLYIQQFIVLIKSPHLIQHSVISVNTKSVQNLQLLKQEIKCRLLDSDLESCLFTNGGIWDHLSHVWGLFSHIWDLLWYLPDPPRPYLLLSCSVNRRIPLLFIT